MHSKQTFYDLLCIWKSKLNQYSIVSLEGVTWISQFSCHKGGLVCREEFKVFHPSKDTPLKLCAVFKLSREKYLEVISKTLPQRDLNGSHCIAHTGASL